MYNKQNETKQNETKQQQQSLCCRGSDWEGPLLEVCAYLKDGSPILRHASV